MEPVFRTSEAKTAPRRLLLTGWTKHGTYSILALVLLFGVLIIPAVRKPRDRFPTRARIEIMALVTAIDGYRQEYGRFPVSQSTAGGSYTYVWNSKSNALGASNRNADLMAILLVLEKFPDGTFAKANPTNERNPRKIRFIDVKMARDNKSGGVGLDGNFRDPWGNPYVIALDIDFDGYCLDPVYSQPAVTRFRPQDQRPNQLGMRTNEAGLVELPFESMIWSLGPDGKADPTIPADQGVNRDNILSWQ